MCFCKSDRRKEPEPRRTQWFAVAHRGRTTKSQQHWTTTKRFTTVALCDKNFSRCPAPCSRLHLTGDCCRPSRSRRAERTRQEKARREARMGRDARAHGAAQAFARDRLLPDDRQPARRSRAPRELKVPDRRCNSVSTGAPIPSIKVTSTASSIFWGAGCHLLN